MTIHLKTPTFVCLGILLSAGAAYAQPFPEVSDCDVFKTTARFDVTLCGATCSALLVEDPATAIGRSAVITEATELPGGNPVCTGVPAVACTACDPTVADADIACFPFLLSGADPDVREIHTEMVSLALCGPCNCGTCCYLAGQPAFNALNALGAAAKYMNTFGEIESQDLTGDRTKDLLADAESFWAVKAVVTVSIPPCGSGTYYTTAPALMSSKIGDIPPEEFRIYKNVPGHTVEGPGPGPACGALPVALFDAVGDVARGQINASAEHDVGGPPTPSAISKWGVLALTLLLLAAAVIIVRRRVALTRPAPG